MTPDRNQLALDVLDNRYETRDEWVTVQAIVGLENYETIKAALTAQTDADHIVEPNKMVVDNDAFDSMNDYRLQEIAVLKSQNEALVRALELIGYCKTYTVEKSPHYLVSVALKALSAHRAQEGK